MSVAIALNNANAVQNSTVIVNPGNLLLFNSNSGAIKTFNLGGLSGNGGISLVGGYPVTLSVGGNGMATTYSGVLNGLGGLTKTGKGVLVLTGTNIYAGGTTISAGTLQIGGGGTTGSVPATSRTAPALAFDRSNNLVLGSAISGTGSLTQDAARHSDARGQQHLQRRHDDLGRLDLVEQRQRRAEQHRDRQHQQRPALQHQ